MLAYLISLLKKRPRKDFVVVFVNEKNETAEFYFAKGSEAIAFQEVCGPGAIAYRID